MRRLAAILFCALSALAQQQRIASDFEIAQMEKQLAKNRTVSAVLSGHLNLGDLRAARNEPALARAEYEKVVKAAERERLDARVKSDLARYATATGYAALAQAKLGRELAAFQLSEEAIRYASHDPDAWNLYGSAMRVLGHPRKAASVARNAVAAADPDKPLDLGIYQYTLATALLEAGEPGEAERLLVTVAAALRSEKFADLQKRVAREEAFEVYSSVRGDVAAYVSLLNRAQLQLAALYEERGDHAKARAEYERVLEARSDDPTALIALARLAESRVERERRYAEAFGANPFAMELVREYQDYLAATQPEAPPAGGGPGAQMRRALAQIARREMRAARTTLDAMIKAFPDNATLRVLRAETESAAQAVLPGTTPRAEELRALLASFERLTPEQRVQLDAATFTSVVEFANARSDAQQTIFESGTIDGVRFRFGEPTAFAGTFGRSVRLHYRILGVTRSGDADVLLLEPVRVEAMR